jgi:hypothetical protein
MGGTATKDATVKGNALVYIQQNSAKYDYDNADNGDNYDDGDDDNEYQYDDYDDDDDDDDDSATSRLTPCHARIRECFEAVKLCIHHHHYHHQGMMMMMIIRIVIIETRQCLVC